MSNPKIQNGLIKVTGGSFIMGNASDLDPDSSPQHKVTVSTFAMDKTEVTVGEYLKWKTGKGPEDRYVIMVPESPGANKLKPIKYGSNDDQLREIAPKRGGECTIDGTTYEYCDIKDHYQDSLFSMGFDARDIRRPETFKMPAVKMTKDLASSFCQAKGGDLPSEAQWEYAAAAGSKQLKFGTATGELTADNAVWGGLREASVVATDGPRCNSLGICDMSGNVGEYVLDTFAPYEGSEATDPVHVGEREDHVIRGGWFEKRQPNSLRTTRRDTVRYSAIYGWRHIGFRCAYKVSD